MATRKRSDPTGGATCIHCAFHHSTEGLDFCRRYPPVLVEADEDGATFMHPLIDHDGWCGEFKGKQ